MTTIHRIGPLFTDLYELTMAAGYFDHGITAEASFSMFIRGNKTPRRCYVAAGLAPALETLGGLRFSAEDLRYLASTGFFSQKFPKTSTSKSICAIPKIIIKYHLNQWLTKKHLI